MTSAKPTSPRSVSLSRLAAFEILLRVERESSFASELLHRLDARKLQPRDIALCTELVMGCLRWQNLLDFRAQQFAKGRWGKFDPEVKVAIRLGVYQLLFLTRVPTRAAIAESVELVRRAKKSSACGLVNAILRKVADTRELEGGPASDGFSSDRLHRPTGMSDSAWAAIQTAHPGWLMARWTERDGLARAIARAEKNNLPPELHMRNQAGVDSSKLIAQLAVTGVVARQGNILKDCLTIERGDVFATELFTRGDVVAQDQASQLVPLLLNVRAGEQVLDLCAAPGNKTSLLAQAAGPSGSVVAGDIHLHRLRRLMFPSRAEAQAPIHRLVLDGTATLPFSRQFDRVLVDAPCSGTGTLRRNPEIKWRLQEEDIIQLARLQAQLIRQASISLRPGGRMVYSTCSFEREENQMIVRGFLEENPGFRLVPLRDEFARISGMLTDPDAPQVRTLFAEDYLETSPEAQGTDGFFAAILEKNGE